MQCLYFALDLKDDPKLIESYEEWHRPERIWPEVVESLRTSGIEEIEIFRCGNRLVMAMEVPETFAAAAHFVRANADERLTAWEELMWKFQQSLPFAGPGEKWVPMVRIFSLKEAVQAHAGRV